MKILLINLEFDCAGVAWNLRQAISNHFPEHEVKHVCFRHTHAALYTDYKFDNVQELMPLVEWADVLHFNQWIWTHRPGHKSMDFLPYNEYGKGNPFEEYLSKKKVIFHCHGGPLQLDPYYWVHECKRVGARMIKCDPILPVPEADWLPNVLDIEIGSRFQDISKVPFKVAIMGSRDDERRINVLIGKTLASLNIDHAFFGCVPRDKALKMREQYPVTIDNTTQGFVGMWSWEALAMGQVVLARLDPLAEKEYKNIIGEGKEWPGISNVSNIDWIAYALRTFRNNPHLLKMQSDRSVRWMRLYYNQPTIARKYLEVYDECD